MHRFAGTYVPPFDLFDSFTNGLLKMARGGSADAGRDVAPARVDRSVATATAERWRAPHRVGKGGVERVASAASLWRSLGGSDERGAHGWWHARSDWDRGGAKASTEEHDRSATDDRESIEHGDFILSLGEFRAVKLGRRAASFEQKLVLVMDV